ncbi:hypothetical protein C8F01DRAFT_619093 [Mycena amicta]|nr:hypothetical protein C8F01DRAFT_619093 [Mycena amicta]
MQCDAIITAFKLVSESWLAFDFHLPPLPPTTSQHTKMSSHLLQTVQAPHGHQATSDTVALLQAPSQSPPTMAMFNGCSNITINGGTFTMAPPTEAQEDFRTIRVGDINLLSLVQEENIVENRVVLHRKRPGRVHCQKVHIATRKTYHAKIFGSQDIFTVMAYEGNLSEWKRKSAGKVLRHPNHIQLFGITDSSRMHAVIYHDELVPANDTLQRCPTSLSRRLLHYVMSIHFQVRVFHLYLASLQSFHTLTHRL